MKNVQFILSIRFDKSQYPIVTRRSTINTVSPQTKYGGKMVVCHPGTIEVEKSNEKGTVNNNKIKKARKGIYGFVIK